jgi:hypothetical protein
MAEISVTELTSKLDVIRVLEGLGFAARSFPHDHSPHLIM